MLYNSISSITYPKFSQYNGLVFELAFVKVQLLWNCERLISAAIILGFTWVDRFFGMA